MPWLQQRGVGVHATIATGGLRLEWALACMHARVSPLTIPKYDGLEWLIGPSKNKSRLPLGVVSLQDNASLINLVADEPLAERGDSGYLLPNKKDVLIASRRTDPAHAEEGDGRERSHEGVSCKLQTMAPADSRVSRCIYLCLCASEGSHYDILRGRRCPRLVRDGWMEGYPEFL